MEEPKSSTPRPSTGTGAGSEAAAAAAASSSSAQQKVAAGTAAGNVTVSDLDRQIAALRRCEYLKESEVKAICSKAREILVDESNVQRVDAPVTVSRWKAGRGIVPLARVGEVVWERGGKHASYRVVRGVCSGKRLGNRVVWW